MIQTLPSPSPPSSSSNFGSEEASSSPLEMARKKERKPIVRITIGDDSAAAATRFRNTNKKLPSRPPLAPPPPPPRLESSEPPSHLQQVATLEDLSFADFSALDSALSDSVGHHHHASPDRHASLSGFLEESPRHQNGHNVHLARKVSAVDVASVGNASDTMVQNMATRDLHEKAKLSFNAADYTTALPLFEAILSAQVRRFSPLHPSVGAAMHNVGVRERIGNLNARD
jgi:hypothetical protein